MAFAPIHIDVVTGDVMRFPADVLALKYAQTSHGVDAAAATQLWGSPAWDGPEAGDCVTVPAQGRMAASAVFFLGVQPIRHFRYREIREFGREVLRRLDSQVQKPRDVALTLHGADYGLDELEAFDAEIAGILEAVQSGTYPPSLERVSIVEIDPERARRVRERLRMLVPLGFVDRRESEFRSTLGAPADEALREAGYGSGGKPYVFVAMPFSKEMDDVFHHGIMSAVNAAGFLCERADLASFVGDVMEWVKTRIRRARLVVAELSGANPNVYLEVGYAWACTIPTVLVIRDPAQLTFNVRGNRCLVYESIPGLEQSLRRELEVLKGELHLDAQ